MKTDLNNEVRRKLIHLSALVLPISYMVCFDITVMLIISGTLTAIALVIEWLRLKFSPFTRFFLKYFGAMLRPDENHSITAAAWMIISVFISILIFQKSVAFLILICFIAGDGIASLIGRRFGKILFFKKTAEGSAACLLTCLISGFLFSDMSAWIWIAGAFVVTAVEVLPMKINDNISVPLIGGSLMEILVWIEKI